MPVARTKAPRPLSTPSAWLADRAAGALLRGLSLIPRSKLRALAGFLGRVAYGLGIRRRVTLENLRAAFPERTERERRVIAQGAYANMAQAFLEGVAFSAAATDAPKVTVENWGALGAALQAGKGVLVATAHFGSWEVFGEVMARRGVRLSAVVRPLRGSLNARLMENRRRSGINLIAARGSISQAVKALGRGETVAMLVDQAIRAEQGVFVPFFGRPASTSPALTLAALRSGAPVFVAMAARENGALRVFIEGPFPVTRSGDRQRDVAEHTERITAVIERYIRRYPEQWLWLHRRWKVQPPPV